MARGSHLTDPSALEEGDDGKEKATQRRWTVMLTTTDKDLVMAATVALLDDRDLGSIDKYFGPTYVQHSAFIADGIDGMRESVRGLPSEFRYERAHVLSQGDVVALHGRYRGIGAGPLIAWDLYRVADGRIVEHWDGRQAEVTETVSGHSMLDGPTEVTQPGATAANQRVVELATQGLLIENDMSVLDRYWVADEAYVQHNPRIPDTVSGLRKAFASFAEEGTGYTITRRHRTVAEGEFVLTVHEGTTGHGVATAAAPTIFYDLFRLDDGLIAEHWDVISDIPRVLPQKNGVF
jgi:predicted SnoaL-like aldol condensation-catalyzing enzyme